ncbi:MAG TPA: hypothetical protein VGF87_06405 [Acidimicrobiales bacterium]
MVDRPCYTVVATRDGKWWSLEVAEVPGVFSQARRLDQAEEMARDALALFLDVAPDSFEVKVDPQFDERTQELLRSLGEARAAVEARQREVATAMREVADRLMRQQGLTVRDVGVVMGVSFQRVAQVTKELEKT